MLEKFRRFGRLIKIEHTLFALPFSLGSLILASGGCPRAATAGWVLLSIVSGRSFAMAANRVIDRHIDSENPRTQNRELPSGLLGINEVLIFMLVTASLLLFAVIHLPPLCFKLLPVAMALLIGYSYTKFFTPLCHFVLGATLATPVIGARIAVTGRWEWASLWLGLGVLVWVAGFDILYACQDIDFDRSRGLHSIPRLLGAKSSMRLSLTLHRGVTPALLIFGVTQSFRWPYYVGMLAIAVILYWEHTLCREGELSRVEKAFFDANVMVSITFLLTSIATVAI